MSLKELVLFWQIESTYQIWLKLNEKWECYRGHKTKNELNQKQIDVHTCFLLLVLLTIKLGVCFQVCDLPVHSKFEQDQTKTVVTIVDNKWILQLNVMAHTVTLQMFYISHQSMLNCAILVYINQWVVKRYFTSNRTAIIEVRSASFRLVLHSQHIFANCFNFLVTWELPVTIFHSACIFCVYGMTQSHCTGQDCSSLYACTYRLFAGMWRPLVSVITTLYYVAIVFHRRVWYRALSLCCVCIRSSGIILIP